MVQSVERSAMQIIELLTGYAQGQGAQSLEASFVAIRDALQAALGGGGGGGDPLALEHYLSVLDDKPTPVAASGSIRLPQDSYIMARDVLNAEDVRLIGYESSLYSGSAVVSGDDAHILFVSGADDTYGQLGDSSNRWNLWGYVAWVDYVDADSVYPRVDGAGSLGIVGRKWGTIIATLPTTDPNVAGSVYSMDAAGLAAELAAGSRYLLISNGP